METFLAGVVGFVVVITFLVVVLQLAKFWLVGSGQIKLVINGETSDHQAINRGNTLLETLNHQGILIPSACGGKGICGACKVQVLSGGGSILPVEEDLINKKQARQGTRLACQLKVKYDLSIALPREFLAIRQWSCKVRSSRQVGSFIKEIVLELPAEETLPFQAGDYIQVECPPYELDYASIKIEARHQKRWQALELNRFKVVNEVKATRSYSLANSPDEKGIIMLNVRIMPPPQDKPDVPPGIVSSYLFSLEAGDSVVVSGPFGKLHAHASDAEMVFIGGGAGMAPMRSIIRDQLCRLASSRRIKYWYGAKSLTEAFYQQEFEQLAHEHDNFSWTLVLSSPLPEDNWQGPSGFVHQAAFDQYLCDHEAPEDIEYYLCGPPPMVDACIKMLEQLGVEPENIAVDKFG